MKLTSCCSVEVAKTESGYPKCGKCGALMPMTYGADWRMVEVDGGWIKFDGKGPPNSSHPFTPWTPEQIEMRKQTKALEEIARNSRRRNSGWPFFWII